MGKFLLVSALMFSVSTPAMAAEKKGATPELQLTDRQISLTARITVPIAQKYSRYLLTHDAAATAPIYLLIATSSGSAQGVMILADTIRALKSPVVAVAQTDLFGAGAALAVMADRLVMYRSAGLHFTELVYEGVRKPKLKSVRPKRKPPTPPSPTQLFLQSVRKNYLNTFWGNIGRRIGMKGDALAKAVTSGGLSISAAEAVKKKIAHSLVLRMSYHRLADESREVKVTTIKRRLRTVPPAKK